MYIEKVTKMFMLKVVTGPKLTIIIIVFICYKQALKVYVWDYNTQYKSYYCTPVCIYVGL